MQEKCFKCGSKFDPNSLEFGGIVGKCCRCVRSARDKILNPPKAIVPPIDLEKLEEASKCQSEDWTIYCADGGPVYYDHGDSDD